MTTPSTVWETTSTFIPNLEGGKKHPLYNSSLLNTLDGSTIIPADKEIMQPLGNYNKEFVVSVLHEHSDITQNFDKELIEYMQDNKVPASLEAIITLIDSKAGAREKLEDLRTKFLQIKEWDKNIHISRILANYKALYRQQLSRGWLLPIKRVDGTEGQLDRTSGQYTIMSNIITLLLLQRTEK